MFNDAASAPAGRLIDRNPFANLRLPSSRGRKDVQLPNEAEMARFIVLADELTPPSFVIAAQLGHRDGGKLVRTTYGHPDARIAREKVRDAYRTRPTVPTPLRVTQDAV